MELGDQEVEEWRPCLCGNYEVSNLGRLRRSGRILKLFVNKKRSLTGAGYLRTVVSLNGVTKNIEIHKLVAEAFLGTCPAGKEVNHRDLNSLNNRWDNLEYITHRGNIRHAVIKGAPVGFSNYGETNGNSKLTEDQIVQIRKLHKTGEFGTRRLATLFNVKSKNTISMIVKRQTWKQLAE